jgi:hypothetical protein
MGDYDMQAATDERITAKATSLVPLDTLAATIKVRIEKGDKATSDADGHYLAAGMHLREAKERLPVERPGLMFTGFIRNVCRMGTSRAYELIAIAEGRLTLEEIRAKKNESSKAAHAKTREAAKAGFPLNSGKTKSQQQQVSRDTDSPGPTEDDCDDCDNAEQRWERSLGNVAGDAISLCSFWTREFGEEWENFEVPSTAVTLAKQAAKAWTELATNLTKRRKASLN